MKNITVKIDNYANKKLDAILDTPNDGILYALPYDNHPCVGTARQWLYTEYEDTMQRDRAAHVRSMEKYRVAMEKRYKAKLDAYHAFTQQPKELVKKSDTMGSIA